MWSLAYEHAKATAVPTRRMVLAVVAAASLAPLAVVSASPVPLRALAAALSVFAIAVAVRAFRGHRAPPEAAEATLAMDAEGVVRTTPQGTKTLARFDAPFGTTMLAACGRDVAVLAFTSPSQTRYVPIRIDGANDDDDALFADAAVLADLDLVDGFAHEPTLSTSSASTLLRKLDARSPGALRRLFLATADGMPIALADGTLRIGERAFDLNAPLTWRVLMFHESTGTGSALYQATALEQGEASVVLVAPMPSSIVPRDKNPRDGRGRLGQKLARHLRLMQTTTEPPPPRELRVAIDRPFMMAVRRALDEAPRAQTSVLKARSSWDASTSPPRSTT